MDNGTPIIKLVEAVQESAKYRSVCPELIFRVGRKELATRPSLKIAIKETKNTLHQIAGAYLDSVPRYADWQRELEAAHGPEAIRELCLRWMAQHASTRERLPFLETFYPAVLAEIGTIRSVIDIACGLNPLSLPWMGLGPEVRYDSCDLYGDMMGFVAAFLQRIGQAGSAQVCDAAVTPPGQEADLALILKFLPVLEQTERGSTLAWLQRLHAPVLLVSFPTRSLGGRGKGMAEHYETRFRETIRPQGWNVLRFAFPNELCFLIRK